MTMNIIVTGDEQLTARFSRIGPQLHAGLLSEITEISEDLENYIKNDKLLGQVLNQRSGALRESIHNDVTDQGSTITGRIFSAAPMPYAAIHEYGGTIPAHVVEPVEAAALHFIWGGEEVFFKKVNIPAIDMPERSYMRSALADSKAEIVNRLRGVVATAIE